MSTTHAAHSDQASQVAVRTLILLAFFAGSVGLVGVTSLKLGLPRKLHTETNSESLPLASLL